MPSVAASLISDFLLPHAATVSAVAMRANVVSDFIEIGRIRGGSLSSGDGRPAAPSSILLEDRTQAAHRAAVLPAQPATGAQRLADPVRHLLRGALERERHARRVRADRLELVRAQRPDPVELARAPGL